MSQGTKLIRMGRVANAMKEIEKILSVYDNMIANADDEDYKRTCKNQRRGAGLVLEILVKNFPDAAE